MRGDGFFVHVTWSSRLGLCFLLTSCSLGVTTSVNLGLSFGACFDLSKSEERRKKNVAACGDLTVLELIIACRGFNF
jgi:hypothetical protein